MLVFTQLVQVSRAMTTFENMTGIHTREATTALTSTGTPLDPSLAAAATSTTSAGGHGGRHKGGMLKQWSRILGVDPFIETITGRGAATGNSRRKKKNPYSRGCVSNCKDFWCDPAPIFRQRERNGCPRGWQSGLHGHVREPYIDESHGHENTRGVRIRRDGGGIDVGSGDKS